MERQPYEWQEDRILGSRSVRRKGPFERFILASVLPSTRKQNSNRCAGATAGTAATEWSQPAEGYVFDLEHLQNGMKAPDFEATDADGVKFHLSDYRGKVVLLDFWGFW